MGPAATRRRGFRLQPGSSTSPRVVFWGRIACHSAAPVCGCTRPVALIRLTLGKLSSRPYVQPNPAFTSQGRGIVSTHRGVHFLDVHQTHPAPSPSLGSHTGWGPRALTLTLALTSNPNPHPLGRCITSVQRATVGVCRKEGYTQTDTLTHFLRTHTWAGSRAWRPTCPG